MEKIEIKKLKKTIGKLGLGAGPFGAIYGDTSIPECGLTLRKAVDASVNYIDTAPWYGQGLNLSSYTREMDTIKIDKLQKSVGKLSLGGAPFGACYGDDVKIEECRAVIKQAFDAKVNYIDTAPWYGQGDSEEMLGRFLPDYDRDSFVIATKVGRYNKKAKEMFDFSYAKTISSVNKSLNLLGLDYVDIIQVHDCEFAPSLDVILNETLPALEKVKQSGKAKMIGVTGYPIEPLNELIERSTVQIDMGRDLNHYKGSLADQKLNEYLPKWKERGIFVVNASPLAMGLFRNDGPQPWHPANNDLKEKVKECIEMCNQRGHNISRIALRYAMDNIAADIVLCGTARVKELEENILNAKTPLNEDETKTMNDILDMLKDSFQLIHAYLKLFKGLSGHWEGRELEAYNNRLKDIDDDLPFFRD